MIAVSRHSRRVGRAEPATTRDRDGHDHHGPRGSEPGRRGDERRDGLDDDTNGEVGRAPDDVQDQDRASR